MFNVSYQEKGGRRKRLDFSGTRCAIGRDKKNDFVIRARNVSKIHAEIIFDPQSGCRISDHGSRTGTWVNQEKIVAPKVLSENDELIVGDVRIWVHIDEESLNRVRKDE